MILRKDSNALGVCLRLEALALALKEDLQLLIIGDDAIVDDGEAVSWITPGTS